MRSTDEIGDWELDRLANLAVPATPTGLRHVIAVPDDGGRFRAIDVRERGFFTSMVRRVELVVRKRTVDSTTAIIYDRSANTRLRKHQNTALALWSAEHDH